MMYIAHRRICKTWNAKHCRKITDIQFLHFDDAAAGSKTPNRLIDLPIRYSYTSIFIPQQRDVCYPSVLPTLLLRMQYFMFTSRLETYGSDHVIGFESQNVFFSELVCKFQKTLFAHVACSSDIMDTDLLQICDTLQTKSLRSVVNNTFLNEYILKNKNLIRIRTIYAYSFLEEEHVLDTARHQPSLDFIRQLLFKSKWISVYDKIFPSKLHANFQVVLKYLGERDHVKQHILQIIAKYLI